MWGIFVDLWKEFRGLCDRLVGWLNYVFGGAEDPYVYTTFHENI